MDASQYVFMGVGVVVVVIVGRLMMLTGRRYVGGAGGAGDNVGQVATLLATVFHLVTLGIVALIAVLPTGDGTSGFLVRLGLLLLLVGVVYGVFVGALARRREVAISETTVDVSPIVTRRRAVHPKAAAKPKAKKPTPSPQPDQPPTGRAEGED